MLQTRLSGGALAASSRFVLGTLLCVVGLSACVTPGLHEEKAPAVALLDNEQLVLVRGAWLRVRVAGTGGTPVVMVHGYGSRLEAFSAVQKQLAQTQQTVAFDQRGFGKSERPEGGYGPEAHAEDVVALMDALHIERAILVGHSYGGGVVARVAMRHPERVAALVLVSPLLLDAQRNSYLRWAQVPGVGEYLYSTSYRSFNGEKALLAFQDGQRFVSLAMLEEVEQNQSLPGTTYAALATVRQMDYADVESGYARITTPTTLVWGEKDRVLPFRLAPSVLRAFPVARLDRVPDVGHMPLWEAPDAVVAAVLASGDAVAPTAAPPPTPVPAEAPSATPTPATSPTTSKSPAGGR